VLPEETRPLVCRLYPYEYTFRGIHGEHPYFCPTELVDPSGLGMSKVLGMSQAVAERWRRQLYLELGITAAEPSR